MSADRSAVWYRDAFVWEIVEAVREALVASDDLRHRPWRGDPNPYAGHCYVACEAVKALAAKGAVTLHPCFVAHQGQPHWFLRADDDTVFDPTADQFTSDPPYALGVGKGFLTREPSKRARDLLARVDHPYAQQWRSTSRIDLEAL